MSQKGWPFFSFLNYSVIIMRTGFLFGKRCMLNKSDANIKGKGQLFQKPCAKCFHFKQYVCKEIRQVVVTTCKEGELTPPPLQSPTSEINVITDGRRDIIIYSMNTMQIRAFSSQDPKLRRMPQKPALRLRKVFVTLGSK